MKKIILTILGILYFINGITNPIDKQKAQQVAEKFCQTIIPASKLKTGTNVTLVYQSKSQEKTLLKSTSVQSYFYVFNINADGYIIVSGDDASYPILGYSNTHTFVPENIPQNVAKWLEGYKNQIRYLIVNKIRPTESITKEWDNIISNDSRLKSGQAVSPLISTQWNQSPYYNSLCPGGSVTGCVATAMAQVMKYWNYPATGSGFHSYNHSNYGTLSANFGSTTYQWGSMPNNVTSSNNAVATLMYHCGVSVNMDYSPESSGAYVISAQSPVTNCSEYALKTYFGYKNTLKGIQRINYTELQWLNLLKAELDGGRPIIYAGFGSGGGHCFIADGYDINNYIHFNWGWGGAYDGYFAINALNPGGVGTGGGSGSYNSGHQALIGIEPPTITNVTNLGLYNYVTPSAGTIGYGQPFSVTTNIVNNGTGTFTGDYCAAIFDNTLTFIDYVEIKTGYTLQSGYTYTNDLVFSNAGSFNLLPGSYQIRIFYRPTGGNWVQISDYGAYTNSASINFVNQNDIALNSNILITPDTAFTQGQSGLVNLNIRNDGTSTFIGTYGVGIYNIDGTLAQTIGTYNETSGLQAGFTYLSPFLTFSTPTITVNPGTYLIAVQHNPNNTGWQLTGSTYYQNPIKVKVVLPSLSQDIYENNNTNLLAYELPVTFINNAASMGSNGSNIHINTDVDYFKISLAAGYNYTLTSRIHDSFNSGNGNIYSADVLFSYSLDGVNWSDTYDDVMPGNFLVNGAKTVYFKISPYFAGITGTYLLDLQISRTANVGFNDDSEKSLILLYPNPTDDLITFDFGDLKSNVTKIQIINNKGQIIKSFTPQNNENILHYPVNDLNNGTYIVQIITKDSIFNRKITIKR